MRCVSADPMRQCGCVMDPLETQCIASLKDPSCIAIETQRIMVETQCIASLQQPKISLFSFDENCVDRVFGFFGFAFEAAAVGSGCGGYRIGTGSGFGLAF